MAQSRAELVSRQPSAEQPHLGLYAIMLHRPPGTVAAEKKATFVGSIGLIRLAPDGVSYEVGYGILPEYWGRGYAPEALRLLLAYYWESDSMLFCLGSNGCFSPCVSCVREETNDLVVCSTASERNRLRRHRAGESPEPEGSGESGIHTGSDY